MLTFTRINEIDGYQGATLQFQRWQCPDSWPDLLTLLLEEFPEISQVRAARIQLPATGKIGLRSWHAQDCLLVGFYYSGFIPADELSRLELTLSRLLPPEGQTVICLFQRLPVKKDTEASALSMRLLHKGELVLKRAFVQAA